MPSYVLNSHVVANRVASSYALPAFVADANSTQFSPKDIAGLKVWFDFSDISTLFQDAAGTTPVVADADPIGRVNDKSGNANNATQATTTAKPGYKVNIRNGRAAALSDGGDRMATAAFVAEAVQPNTLFAVSTNPDISDSGAIFDGIASDKRTQIWPATGKVNWYAGTQRVTGTNYPTTAVMFCITANGASSVLRMNGSQIDAGNIGANGLTGLTLFNDYRNAGFSQLSGYIMEVLLYNGTVSAGNIALIEAYLNNKWAVY